MPYDVGLQLALLVLLPLHGSCPREASDRGMAFASLAMCTGKRHEGIEQSVSHSLLRGHLQSMHAY